MAEPKPANGLKARWPKARSVIEARGVSLLSSDMEIDNSNPRNGKSSKADARIAADLRRRLSLLAPGALLPSVRALSAEYAASPVTVHRAVAQLAREGRVVTRPGDGTYAVERAREGPRADSSWQLTVLGRRVTPLERRVRAYRHRARSRSARAIRTCRCSRWRCSAKPLGEPLPRARWDRMPPEGHPDLRLWFARDVGGGARAEDVILVSGGQAALAATFRTLVPFWRHDSGRIAHLFRRTQRGPRARPAPRAGAARRRRHSR